ncbi:unnamed protein product, partial [marine sediment metagenome]
ATFIYTSGRRTLYAYQTNDEPFRRYQKLSLYEIPPEVALKRIAEKMDAGFEGEIDEVEVEKATKSALGVSLVRVVIESVSATSHQGALTAKQVVEERKTNWTTVYDVRSREGKLILLKKRWCRNEDEGRMMVAGQHEMAGFIKDYESAVSPEEAVKQVEALRKKKGGKYFYESISVREKDVPDDILKKFANIAVLQQM